LLFDSFPISFFRFATSSRTANNSGEETSTGPSILGSYPKSVMAPETLWILELAVRRGFREGAQHHISVPGSLGNAHGAVALDSLGRECRIVGVAGTHSGNRISPRFSGVQRNRSWQGRRRPTHGPFRHSRQISALRLNPQLIDGKQIIHNYTFGTGTQKTAPWDRVVCPHVFAAFRKDEEPGPTKFLRTKL
jgi:hypothetical protein